MNEYQRRDPAQHYTLIEVSQMTGLEQSTLVTFIREEWICPAKSSELDDQDVARIRLIQDLRVNFGVNDYSIPIILHLLDQLYHLRNQIRSQSICKR